MSISQVLFLSLALGASEAPPTQTLPVQPPVRLAQVFTDLPGVVTQEEAEDRDRIFCEQTVVKREGNPTRGERYRTVNNCRRGNGPVFTSPRTPLSLERQKRGLDY